VALQELPNWILSIFLLPDASSINEEAPLFFDDDMDLFYQQTVCLTKEKAVQVCQMTLGQSVSSLWRDERKFRVTASRAHRIFAARSADNRLKYFLDTKCLDGIAALKYGLEMETFAREKFEELSGYKVIQVGLMVKVEKPWLAATPDGLFLDSEWQRNILEIKCPYSNKDKDIDVPYLKDGKLNQRHAYFTQIQLQLYVCKAKKATLFIYSSNDSRSVQVPYDEKYC
jgi:hypothetical protein